MEDPAEMLFGWDEGKLKPNKQIHPFDQLFLNVHNKQINTIKLTLIRAFWTLYLFYYNCSFYFFETVTTKYVQASLLNKTTSLNEIT